MTSMSRRASTIVVAIFACLACHDAIAETLEQARVISSTPLPGGKYTVTYEYAGIEYLTITAHPPGVRIPVRVSPATQAPGAPVAEVACADPEGAPCTVLYSRAAPSFSAPVVPTRNEVLPVSSSYVGGFFIDPISAVLGAVGLGLLLNGGWHHNSGQRGR